jgi:hypothetical protein
MRESNKLNTALKTALQGHEESLREAQWLRLRAEMGVQKSKKRFLPWFMLFCVVALSGLGVGYWIGHNANENQVSVENQANKSMEGMAASGRNKNTESEINQNKEGSNKNDQPGSEKGLAQQGNTGNNSPADGPESKTETNKSGKQSNDHAGHDQSSGHQDGNKDFVAKDDRDAVKGDVQKDPDKKNSGRNILDADEEEIETEEDAGAENEMASELQFNLPLRPLRKMKAMKVSDSLPKVAEVEKIKKVKVPGPGMDRARFAVSFSTGLSPLNFKVRSIENSEKVHHDSRQVFEQGNENSKSYFGNLGFDWYITKNIPLSFNTGLQYRNIVQEVNQSYTLRDIPFRDNLGNILAYIPDTIQLKDTAGNVTVITDPDALKIQNAGTNRMTFISIPIKMGYMWPLGSKSELQVNAGLNLSWMAGAKGSIIAINEQRTKPLRESYRKGLNLGLAGGLQFNTHLYKSWWIGLEAQWQQNAFNYNDRYGVIRSKINITNYNLVLKYKF